MNNEKTVCIICRIFSVLLAVVLVIALLLEFDSGIAKAKAQSVRTTSQPANVADAYYDLENLPALRPGVVSEEQSSYDRKDSNADSFWWAMDVNDPSAADAVKRRTLLDVKGSGVVYRMWFTGTAESISKQRITIYIDGSSVPVIDCTLTEIFNRSRAMFDTELVLKPSESSGGNTILIPIAFNKSILILGDSIQFYQINYHIFTDGTKLTPFSGIEDYSAVDKVFSELGIDPKDNTGSALTEGEFDSAPGSETELVSLHGTKAIRSIRMKIPEVTVKDFYTGKEVSDNGNFWEADDYGGSAFTMKIDPDNDGVKLVKRMTVNLSYQHVSVTVDGQKLPEVWASDVDDQMNYYRNIEYEIPAEYTKGKSEIRIELKPVKAASMYMEFYFWCYSRTAGEWVLTDGLDCANDESEAAHEYVAEITPERREFTGTYNFLDDPEGKAWHDALVAATNALRIRVYYDGKKTPDVDAPIGSFFGFGDFGIDYIRKHPNSDSDRPTSDRIKALTFGIDDEGWLYFYFMMPFEESAVVTIANVSEDYTVENIEFQIRHKDYEGDIRQVGYFKTQYHAYVPGTDQEPREGKPLLALGASGSGHLVGIVQSIKGPDSRLQLEGDELIYVDGNKTASLYGTGTEDFYSGAWYFSYNMKSNATYGVSVHIKENGQDITCMYRIFTADAISFRNGIQFYMEHGPYNDVMCEEHFLTMYYHRPEALTEKTDILKLDSAASIEKHGYEAEDAEKLTVTSDLEGIYSAEDRSMEESGYSVSGASEFTIKIKPQNAGAVLRRLSYTGAGQYQQAKVFVDDVYVGIFQTRTWTDQDILRYDEFFIPQQYTAGKSSLRVRLENCGDASEQEPYSSSWEGNDYADVWTELSYEAYILLPRNVIGAYSESFVSPGADLPVVPSPATQGPNGTVIGLAVTEGVLFIAAVVIAIFLVINIKRKREKNHEER